MTYSPGNDTPSSISDSSATDSQITVPWYDQTVTTGRKDKVTLFSSLVTRIKDTIGNATTSVAGLLSSSDKTKLDGIAANATANATDAQLRDRSTHTGVQGVSTITGLLDGNSKILTNLLPALALTDTFTIGSQAEMLALTAEPGDVAVRTDLSKSFILAASPASTLANWTELLNPTSPVQSVAGKTGAITLTAADITGGVFADNQIPSSIARDSEVSSAIAALSLGTISTQNANSVSITGGSISPTTFVLPTAALTAIGQLRRNTNAVEYWDSTGATRLLLNNLDNLANLNNIATARSNIKAVGSDATGYTGAVTVGQIFSISQANYDALPSSAQNDASIVWIIT